MKRMRVSMQAVQKWLTRAPRWTALLLGALIALDSAHLAWRLRVAGHPPGNRHDRTPPAELSQSPALAPERISAAHLFGVDPAAAGRGAATPETRRPLALNGVIATADPNEGYAILGEQGQTTRLYRTGAALASLGGGTLYQVFADHVVLDFDGRRETLRLPRQYLEAAAPLRVASLDAPVTAAADRAAVPKLYSQRDDPPSAAEGWFSRLNVRGYTSEGRTGLQLHPAKRFQRRYGLRDGDTLTAVNGVAVADEDSLDDLLRTAGKSVAITLTRDGVEQTRRFPVDE